MPDKTLTCRDCGTNFIFTTAEQEFFASKGFTNEPGRCSACRSARNESRGGSGGRGYGGGGGYERRSQQLFPAVCAQCSKDTQVPFQPRGDRPVYCSTCYETQRGSSGQSRRGGSR
ncbi:MAG: zinc-binding protein [SAR202 cluster bacterium]|nr:zinc-binding protein [SAR202 cluster bacterium]